MPCNRTDKCKITVIVDNFHLRGGKFTCSRQGENILSIYKVTGNKWMRESTYSVLFIYLEDSLILLAEIKVDANVLSTFFCSVIYVAKYRDYNHALFHLVIYHY